MLGQLEDPGLQRAARAASRIAADCYAVGIRQARGLEVIKPDRLREAPLVYLEATESPATAGREERAQLLDASIRQWRNLKLPLPIVLLPVDGTRSISNYCAIHHEVGHNLDQDLDLLPELRGALPDLFPQPDAEKQWRRWSAEILADALGVVLGGVGFALSLGMLALSLFPAARYQEPDADAEHPPLALRVRLLVEMLRHSGVPEQAPVAGQLQAVWEPLPRPAWVEPFVAGAAAVATLFLTRKLDKLKQHSILELNPKAGRDHQQIEALASWLLTGTNRPVAELTQGMSPRIVPSAAQWAIWRAETMDAAELERIQSEAWKYLDVIPPDPVPLAGGLAADRRTYLDSLVTSVDFGKLKRREVP
jgi:hypothetical protein